MILDKICQKCGIKVGFLAWTIPGKDLCLNCRNDEAFKDEPDQKSKGPAQLKIVPRMDWNMHRD